ncbi:DUF4328 domain-containing protein [Streptomyces sp. NPDC004838]
MGSVSRSGSGPGPAATGPTATGAPTPEIGWPFVWRKPGARLMSPVPCSRALVGHLVALIAVETASLVTGAVILTVDGRQDPGPERELGTILALTRTMASLLVVVLFLVWFHMVRRNAQVFAPELQRWSVGWALGGWFLPVGNLFIPRMVAGDLWTASAGDPVPGQGRRRRTVLDLWGVAWVPWLVLVPALSWANPRITVLTTVVYAVDIVAAVLAIGVVRAITRMQDAKRAGEIW